MKDEHLIGVDKVNGEVGWKSFVPFFQTDLGTGCEHSSLFAHLHIGRDRLDKIIQLGYIE